MELQRDADEVKMEIERQTVIDAGLWAINRLQNQDPKAPLPIINILYKEYRTARPSSRPKRLSVTHFAYVMTLLTRTIHREEFSSYREEFASYRGLPTPTPL
jgi:hypothetical protein